MTRDVSVRILMPAKETVMDGQSRRTFLATLIAGIAALATPAIATDEAQFIADRLSSVRTMKGRFVQFAQDGSQSEGTFVLSRPGKVAFRYDGQQGLQVVSDGSSVVIENRKLKTADVYPLSKTPLSTLLADRIDLRGRKASLDRSEGILTLRVTDRSVSGQSTLDITFDASTLALRQWATADARGHETTVVVYDVSENTAVDRNEFLIDWARIGKSNRDKTLR